MYFGLAAFDLLAHSAEIHIYEDTPNIILPCQTMHRI